MTEEITSIRVHRKTLGLIVKAKQHPRETCEDVILRLLQPTV